MYRFFCDNCRKYNYSASKIGKCLCTYCGKELKMRLSTTEGTQRKKERLA